MPKKKERGPAPREVAREDITWAWEGVVNDISSNEEIKYDLVLNLIYQTYEYFYEGVEYNSVLRLDLPIYRNIIEAYSYLADDILCGWNEYEQEALLNTLEGLYWAIDSSFSRGYYAKTLMTGVSNHWSSYEIDMTDYNTFKKGFCNLVDMVHDMYDDGEYDEEEE